MKRFLTGKHVFHISEQRKYQIAEEICLVSPLARPWNTPVIPSTRPIRKPNNSWYCCTDYMGVLETFDISKDISIGVNPDAADLVLSALKLDCPHRRVNIAWRTLVGLYLYGFLLLCYLDWSNGYTWLNERDYHWSGLVSNQCQDVLHKKRLSLTHCGLVTTYI